jgi:hypothetical protein
LREQRVDIPLEDPHDPMIEVEEQRHKPMPPERKVPRLNRDIWERLVDGYGGNSAAAKIKMDQLLKKEADRLLIELEDVTPAAGMSRIKKNPLMRPKRNLRQLNDHFSN